MFSAYELRDGTRIWIITEADRSVTTKDQRLGRVTESWRSTGIERDPQALF